MLRDSVVVAVAVAVAVVRTHPRAIPLAMITMRKSTHGFPFLSYISMGLRYQKFRRLDQVVRNVFRNIDFVFFFLFVFHGSRVRHSP